MYGLRGQSNVLTEQRCDKQGTDVGGVISTSATQAVSATRQQGLRNG